MKTLLVLSLCFIASCASVDWQERTVPEITAKTTNHYYVSAITEFEIKSVGVGAATSRMESGRWYLNSGANYRSSYSLNVHLTPEVVSQFSQKYHIENISELVGKKIKVKGTAVAKQYCIILGCPPELNRTTPEMYLQTQLLITELDNISLL